MRCSYDESVKRYYPSWLDLDALALVPAWPGMNIVRAGIEPVGCKDCSWTGGWAYAQRNMYGTETHLKVKEGGRVDVTMNLPMMEFYRDCNDGRGELGVATSVWRLAGTFLHEVLHQMNWRHPTGVYTDQFVTVAGDCLRANGDITKARDRYVYCEKDSAPSSPSFGLTAPAPSSLGIMIE